MIKQTDPKELEEKPKNLKCEVNEGEREVITKK